MASDSAALVDQRADRLAKLLRTQKTATLEELKSVLGSGVTVTVFRKLKTLEYLSSYSHRGRYYTLDEVAQFNERGLWEFQGIRFSRLGTLLATAEAFVRACESGYFAGELKNELGVGVKDALATLADEPCDQKQEDHERHDESGDLEPVPKVGTPPQ